jgi:transcriptional regulator with XRE-family HTH domain
VSAPQKLTDDQIRLARQVIAKRREVLRQLDLYPTMEQLADQMGVSVRYLSEVVNGRARLQVAAA